jgi:peroxiredoxin
MKGYAKNVVFLFSLFSFLLFGCSSTNNKVAWEQSQAQADVENAVPVKDTNPVEAQVQQKDEAKSSIEDKAIDDLIKKYSNKTASTQNSNKNVRIAPDFDLQDIFFDEYKLSNYKGKQPVILFFWATWCPYCKQELLMVHNRYPKLVKDGVEVFAVNVGEEIEKVSAFIRNLNLGLKVLADTDSSVSTSYRVIGVPTFVLVDTDGNILFQDNSFPEGYKAILSAQEAQK